MGWVVSAAGALLIFLWIIRVEGKKNAAAGGVTLSPLAALSLCFGMTSVVVALHVDLFRPFVLDIVAILTGALALHNINRSNGTLSGKSIATAGIVLGALQAFLVLTFLGSLAR